MVKKNICVFCGASSGSLPEFITLAEKIGKMIGENNFNLIYLLLIFQECLKMIL